MSHAASSDPVEGMKQDWWHLIAAAPLFVIVGALLGGVIQLLLVGSVILLFPISVYYDARYVRAASDRWQPNRTLWLVLGLGVTASLGVLSFLVSPYYVYKRHKAV